MTRQLKELLLKFLKMWQQNQGAILVRKKKTNEETEGCYYISCTPVSSMNQSLAHQAFTDSDPHSTQVKIPPDIRMNESASTPHVEEVSQAAHLPSSTETNT